MKKIALAVLLAATAMPANAYEYLVYEGDGAGWFIDVNGPPNGRPYWTPGFVTARLVIPLDRPVDDWSAYLGYYWSFSGSKVSGLYRDSRGIESTITLNFDHALTDYPRSSDGFLSGDVDIGWHYYGITGTIDDVRVWTMKSDQLLGSVSASFAAPEPASWAMMIGGFALAGAAMRRRTAKVRFAKT